MEHPVDRRAFLRTLSLLILGSTLGTTAQSSEGLTLPQFLRLSELLTGFEALDSVLGERYLTHLRRQPGAAARLRALYEQLGLASNSPPQSLDELSDEILFAREESAMLADAIVEFWCEARYSALSIPWILTSSSARRG